MPKRTEIRDRPTAAPRAAAESPPPLRGRDREGGPRALVSRARTLRRKQTDAERTLWFAVRRNAVAGAPFRRQQPIGTYVVDFYCSRAKLVVEIDGGQHNDAAVAARDAKRTRWLEGEGYRVLRFWNNDVLTNLDGVVESIRLAILNTPLPGPPPQVGRETGAQPPHSTATFRRRNRLRES